MKVNGYAANRAGARLRPVSFEPEPLAPEDVEVAVSHCGICHSDVHLVDGDWGDVFPLVPGHEIIGSVVGGAGHAPGTRVGIGWQRSSCGECEHCRGGEEELCHANQATCVRHFGGFAERVRVNRRFAIPIPDALPSAAAAPLLCGGITVYSPLRRFARPGARVGVLGIGGLGHLGVQLARALGCEVWAFSRRTEKEADARRLGASHFSTEPPPRGTLDLVLNTAHGVPHLDEFLAALRPKGVFCQLGASAEPLAVASERLIGRRLTICGSAIGSPGAIAEMLALAAAQGVAAITETMPMAQVNEGLARTRGNRAHYRVVLVS
jgi:alcohol/geraniol dehydrogenase (NADP+)